MLSEANPAQSPQFSDAGSCRQWLNALPLTNVPLAHATLAAQLELLNRAPIPPLERLKISELLREPVAFVQQELSRKYLARPLPLEAAQLDAWSSAAALWAAMGAAYQLCLDACREGDPGVAGHIAPVTQRCLRYAGLQMMEHYRACREIGEDLWRQAHALYELAERQDYAARPVKDSLDQQADATTCAAAYARILLADLADPYRLTSRQLALLDRWLEKWAIRATVVSVPPADAALSRVAVDLAGGACRASQDGQDGQTPAKPRYLDMEQLATTFRKRIRQLRKGEAPAMLGLGEDCAQPDCEALLTTLYQYWCEAAPKQRNFARHLGGDKAQVAFGMAAIHFFLGGEKPFRQPGEKDRLSKREIEDLKLFGRISEQTGKQQLSELGFSCETWEIQDQSALGFRLERPGGDGTRISRKQLVAVRPEDSKTYVLGVIQRLIFPLGGGLHAGIRILPGVPLAIAARPVLPMADTTNKYTPAFLLPDMPVLHETASLVLPSGWFSPDRQVEIHAGEERFTVKLNKLIEKGGDYERVGFVRV